MHRVTVLTVLALLGALTSCASRERIYDNVYEGLRTRESVAHPQPEYKPAAKSPTYSDYDAERKKLLDGNDKK